MDFALSSFSVRLSEIFAPLFGFAMLPNLAERLFCMDGRIKFASLETRKLSEFEIPF